VPAGLGIAVSSGNGVLANDTDPDGDPLTAEAITQPTNGVLSLSPNGSFFYTPNAGLRRHRQLHLRRQRRHAGQPAHRRHAQLRADADDQRQGVSEGNSGTKTLTFTVTLSAPAPAGGVSVNYNTQNSTAGEGDYGVTAGTLTFAAGETSKDVSVVVKGDTKAEGDEAFFLRLNNATGAVIADDRGVGTIVNDDAAAPAPSPACSSTSTTRATSRATAAPA
jgi:hypothetical protein